MARLKQMSAVVLTLITGCSGGGGGSNDDGNTTPQAGVTLSGVISESLFNWAVDGNPAPNEYTTAVRYVYPVDINGDGVEEVIFAGWESQPNTAATFTNSKLAIFGWENGVFKDLTAKLIPGGSGVEGVGQVVFGDFDNNGHIDFYASGNADMDYNLHSYAFMNNGAILTKVDLGVVNGEHGAASADVNGDGFVDVIPVGYFYPTYYYLGSVNGLTRVNADPNVWEPTNGSGMAIADFMGNGTLSIITSDNGNGVLTKNDTILYQLTTMQNGTISFTKIANLPTPRLEDPAFGLSGQDRGDSHDIRAVPLDFNKDNLMDVLVFSRAWLQPGSNEWPRVSQIQFLQNTGNGVFVDVTSTMLVGYDKNSNPAYAPVIRDFNGDGHVDIFTSEGGENSTALLIGQPNGTFVEEGRSTLSAAVHQTDQFGVATVAKGPNNKNYLVATYNEYGNGVAHVLLREMSVR